MLSELQWIRRYSSTALTNAKPQPTQATVGSVSLHCSQTPSTETGKRSGYLPTGANYLTIDYTQ